MKGTRIIGKDVFGYKENIVAGFGQGESDNRGNYFANNKYYMRGYMKDGDEVPNLNGTDVMVRFTK